MKTVLVGIAPARPGEHGFPLAPIKKNSAGYRLMEMIGLSRGSYLSSFDRVNVCSGHRPGSIKPSDFHDSAENLGASLLVGRRVVFLGPNVASCFGVGRNSYDWCEWRPAQGPTSVVAGWRVDRPPPFDWCVIPHPSGRNHLYNDPMMRVEVGELLRAEYLRLLAAPGGVG